MLASFLLSEGDMGAELLPLFAVHVLPAELQQITDAEGGINAEDNEREVTKLSTAAEILR